MLVAMNILALNGRESRSDRGAGGSRGAGGVGGSAEVMTAEFQQGRYTVSTAQERLDVDAVHGFLRRSSWAPRRTRETVVKSIANSLCYGIYDEQTRAQVGFARVVTDYCTFAYLCDVFVDESHRGRGLSKWLMSCIMQHPELRSLRHFLLATKDAHGLYARYGFAPVPGERWMEKRLPTQAWSAADEK